tara:strand:- start:1764 stop:2537 length:774 start_codon:yes stop_codon:yes gene_type:complete
MSNFLDNTDGFVKTTNVTISGRFGEKIYNNLECKPGVQTGTISKSYSTSSDCEAQDKCVFELNDNCDVKVRLFDRCKSVRDRYSYSDFNKNVSKNGCIAKSTPTDYGLSSGGSGYDESIPLEEQVNILKKRWTAATQKYITHYPDSKLNLDSTQYNRALAQTLNVYNDISILKANLDGNISSNDKNLKDKTTEINKIKDQYNDQNWKLKSKLGENKSAIPFKIQKYDENSKSYIFTSGYTIGIFTLLFFMYKQINME